MIASLGGMLAFVMTKLKAYRQHCRSLQSKQPAIAGLMTRICLIAFERAAAPPGMQTNIAFALDS